MTRKADELRSLSDEDLAKRLEESYRQLFTLRFQVATRQLGNHRALRDTRRRIARIKTLQRERELAAQEG
ncbi:MAG TPA: 50S ribosomal protein L29 [Dehalococcoidia bacterium]|nr:50S ribosomal protein L29 [Dehalococcoidia bacterium]